MVRFHAALAALLALAVCASAQPNPTGAVPLSDAEDVPDATVLRPRQSIAAYLSSTGNHEILLLAVRAVGNLSMRLDFPGERFTVFAPTDNAFANLARRFVDEEVDASNAVKTFGQLGAGLEALRDVESASFVDLRSLVTYHVIGEAVPFQELETRGTAVTLQGSELTFVDGAIVDGDDTADTTPGPRNVLATNGWVNVVGDVLLPFQLTTALVDGGFIPAPEGEENGAQASPDAVVTPQPGDVPPVTDGEGAPSPAPAGGDPGTDGPVPVGPVDTGDEGEEIDAETSTEASAEASPEGSAEDDDDDDAVCFPASARATLADGTTLRMDELRGGHSLLTGGGNSESSAIFLFTHRSKERTARFYTLRTANGASVSLTGGHYVRAGGRLVAARAVRVGDELRTAKGPSRVVRVVAARGAGLYAPHTLHGDLVVGGVVVSGYSQAVHPRVAHALLAPVRLAARLTGVAEPLGSAFYGGADRLARWVPSGGLQH